MRGANGKQGARRARMEVARSGIEPLPHCLNDAHTLHVHGTCLPYDLMHMQQSQSLR